MLLSAVSVLVVAQSSSEIPEGLKNNPVLTKESLSSVELCKSSYSVAHPPKSDISRLFWDFRITHRHTHTVWPLWRSDQLVAKQLLTQRTKRRAYMPSGEIEPAIPAIKRLQTYALDVKLMSTALQYSYFTDMCLTDTQYRNHHFAIRARNTLITPTQIFDDIFLSPDGNPTVCGITITCKDYGSV